MFLFLQMPSDPPTTLAAMNWIVIGGLVAALVYVFRAWQNEKRNCVQQDRETIERLLEALHEQVDDVNKP